MNFITSLITLLVLFASLPALMVATGNSNCPCREEAQHCPDSSTTVRNMYRPHIDEQRRLTGDCLPEVRENTVKCYKWKTKTCMDQPEICELTTRGREIDAMPIPVTSQRNKATLFSPRFNSTNRIFGRRYFCVYNFSLSCPRNEVEIRSVPENTTWPGVSNDNCNNYVAFYTSRNSTHLNDRFCGGGPGGSFQRLLRGQSFLAVMWTDERNNIGTFQFTASCQPRRSTYCPISATAAPTTS